MRIKRLNYLRCGERLLKTFKYLQRGTKSTDLLKSIVLDKFFRSFFFGLYIEQQTHFYNYWRLIISVPTRLSPLAVFFYFYTGIVEDRLLNVVSLQKNLDCVASVSNRVIAFFFCSRPNFSRRTCAETLATQAETNYQWIGCSSTFLQFCEY